MYSYATLAPLLGYRDNPLYQKMDEILKGKTKSNPEKFAEYLVVLTNPPKVLKTQEQELKILRLASKAKKRKSKSSKEILSEFGKELDEIRKEFDWLSFDICNSIGWNRKYYAKLVAEKLGFNINQKIRELANYEKKTESNYQKLIKKLHFTTQEQKAFQLVRNLGYYKWARQYEFQKALYHLKFIQDELGGRFGLTQLESKYLLPEEYKQLAIRSEKLKIKAQKRLKNFLVIFSRNKKAIILEGQKAKNHFHHLKFVKDKVGAKSKELKGMPAFSGKGTGMVRIINQKKDLSKMKKGDILVSVATSPDLLTAMKKASAIVTDEGGITCHAAIISRELKIPCVVGVKIATKALRDGDRVEVDANKGIIRKIK
ncbi:MAG: hypothetical protein COY66_06300 [Candidatus Kerfeldbacteria bacterium CG_4_10_14_0_8_um_filter_42_10]|uniref:PEP-utilising enzyme mobile domain-containing protein n=1 Tax=Candidatus Kerfeldbacteria bacterium CG_4_10_14_0_8_um_filter_42_10 TaxID=2014248 RepID=A0A2M7RFU6_9BACT|nr:MAG: hypothetical protein COY66_06300 [Candidatus Kerfeldbacteria bacterium CG_4_10_14_0_8_um_filter_42_10]